MNLTYRPVLSDGAATQLEEYDLPGNVRELQNVIERALILSRGRPLSFPELGDQQRQVITPTTNKAEGIVSLDEAIIRHITHALEQTGGQIAGKGGAAELLKVKPSTLRAKIRKYGLRLGEPRF